MDSFKYLSFSGAVLIGDSGQYTAVTEQARCRVNLNLTCKCILLLSILSDFCCVNSFQAAGKGESVRKLHPHESLRLRDHVT